jgi:hypothetical protein
MKLRSPNAHETIMTRPLLLAAVLISGLPAVAAIAGTTVPNRPMIGSVYESTGKPSVSGSACSVKPGPGSFQREAPTTGEKTPDAMMSLPEVTAKSAGTTVSYTALATLDFSNATSGKVIFDDDENSDSAPKPAVTFAGYSEAYDGKSFKLKITFTLKFKGCTLPVQALFRAAPQPHVVA